MPGAIPAAGANAYAVVNQELAGRILTTLSDGTEVKALGLVPGHPASGGGFASLAQAKSTVQRMIWDTAASAARPAEGVAFLKRGNGVVAAALDDSLIGAFRTQGGAVVNQAIDGSPKLADDVLAVMTGSGEVLGGGGDRLSGQLMKHVGIAHHFPLDKPAAIADAANGAAEVAGGLSRNAKIAIGAGALLGVAALGVGIWALTRD